MSTGTTSTSKLHPIYNALDHQQYNRAIKLCLQQPADHWYAQALLAHAYAKSEQRAKALQVLHRILITSTATSTATATGDKKTTEDYFVELQLAHKYAQTGAPAPSATAPAPANTTTSSSKGGKKGKKNNKPAPKPAVAPAPTESSWDWIDALDTPPTLPSLTDAVPPWPVPAHLADTHLLSTLQLTLQQLRCTWTAYQVYAWWAATLTNNNGIVADKAEVITHLRDTFGLGLAVWMAPQYQYLPVRQQLLPELQVLALQMARLETEVHGSGGTGSSAATLCAAQTALWQCQPADGEPPVEDSKMALLPRLAEGLASKMVQQTTAAAAAQTTLENQTSRIPVESFLLWLQALAVQNKWSEYLQAVQERIQQVKDANSHENDTGGLPAAETLGLTMAMLLDYESRALEHLGQFEAARQVVETTLREQNPDQWNMWIRHLNYDDTDGYQATIQLAQELSLPDTPTETPAGHPPAYPRRGPPLIVLEALRRRIDKSSDAESLLDELLVQIQSFGDAFASRTACTFSDLQACLECLCQKGNAQKAAVLLPWLQTMQSKPSAAESSQRRAQLRAYIFAHQTTLKLLNAFPNLQKEWLPDWRDLVLAWKEFQSFEDDFKAAQTEEERKNAQKESRPADEVILLAVQLLLAQDSSAQGRILAATLLDKAIEQSPYNAYLKLSQIFIYADLDAVSKSWDLFRELFIKHIQHESCAYLILPLLRAGGMYMEVLKVCKEIIRLQITALRDANEYSGKAWENGTLSQADEFVRFQRNRMNKSLTTIEAKGLIMDCAPMFRQDERQIEIGSLHGIVGGEEDIERVHTMIAEAHSPQGTFTLLRLRGDVQENLSRLSENRDLKVMEHEVFQPRAFPAPEEVVRDCIRRSLNHGLLLRAAVCIDATKGPKKGKVVKPTVELTKRCKSLISQISEAQSFAESELTSPEGYGMLMQCITKLCRAIAVLSGGFVGDAPSPEDSVQFREEQTAAFLQEAVEKLQKAREMLHLDTSASRTGLALPDMVLPILALLRMCSKVNDLYGWTKKRRTIRKCAGCLYDFAMALRGISEDMCKSLETVQITLEDFELPSTLRDGIVPGIISEDDVRLMSIQVHAAQGKTKKRIEWVLDSIRTDVDSFDTVE